MNDAQDGDMMAAYWVGYNNARDTLKAEVERLRADLASAQRERDEARAALREARTEVLAYRNWTDDLADDMQAMTDTFREVVEEALTGLAEGLVASARDALAALPTPPGQDGDERGT